MLDQNIELPPEFGELAKDIYSDGVKDTLRELSKIGVDAAKTFRLALAPLQYTAMLQDRLSIYVKRAVEKVDIKNRVNPPPSLALPILEKLRYQEDGDLLTDIYVELLSAGFDSSRVGDAHPAFLTIITQLSSDEVRLINWLSDSDPKYYFGRAHSEWAISSKSIEEHFNQSVLMPVHIDWKEFINPDEFLWPKHLHVYIVHLEALGLIRYDNDAITKGKFGHADECWAITLNEFGTLFHRACVKDAPKEGFSVTIRDRI